MTVSHDPNEYVEPTVEETVDVTDLSNVDLDDLIEMIEVALNTVEEDIVNLEEVLDNLKDMM